MPSDTCPTAVGLQTNNCRTRVGQLPIQYSDSYPSADGQLFSSDKHSSDTSPHRHFAS
ncbi:MAG: hypothetical protein IKK67_01705 [Bacteroidaceae bacterium]|nr:hypothetical protein [Bacteroidaceae bacterium]MBR6589176.1 hypothetical protein [Bacteroidaceae bacterium]